MKFRDDLPESSGGGNYVKLKDKESMSGIFYGELHEFYVLWENGKTREVSPDTPGAKFRFRANFVIKEGAAYVPKIFENSQTVYQQLAELHAEYNLETVVVKITRNGSKLDTTYSILPLRDPVTPGTAACLRTLKLNPLGSQPKTEELPGPSDEAPF